VRNFTQGLARVRHALRLRVGFIAWCSEGKGPVQNRGASRYYKEPVWESGFHGVSWEKVQGRVMLCPVSSESGGNLTMVAMIKSVRKAH
jgi:hypothetical protein